ncbi:MAG: protein kinase [Gemmatimonadetes bacterium]|nr:protein kinase [Gemmatimonadota bacterium]
MNDAVTRLNAALEGRYAIERELGEGGMATVYLARDKKHDRNVALKVLKPDVASEVGAERFMREIKLAARLTHPHILPLHDSGEADGFLYQVMPAMEGQSVRDRLDRERQLPVEEAVQIIREVADALDYAHQHDVVHRDIKPENILLHGGHALVADFGIGKLLSAAADPNSATITRPGVTIGTPMYMSPEQAAGDERLDGRSDLYSLGCVLYEMLVGNPPFTGPTPQVIMARRLTHTPPEVTETRESVSVHVSRVVRRLLARTPADRFATGSKVVEALAKGAPVLVIYMALKHLGQIAERLMAAGRVSRVCCSSGSFIHRSLVRVSPCLVRVRGRSTPRMRAFGRG